MKLSKIAKCVIDYIVKRGDIDVDDLFLDNNKVVAFATRSDLDPEKSNIVKVITENSKS